MCGIVGYVGPRQALPFLMTGLRRLEYRGYDSAGVAVQENGALEVLRAEGKLDNLASIVSHHPAPGHTGIGHTRWATHGRPSEQNAHPHVDCGGVMTERVAFLPMPRRVTEPKLEPVLSLGPLLGGPPRGGERV